MPVWGWVVIAIGVVTLLSLVLWQGMARKRTGRLRQQFGPEYDRTLDTTESKRDAETELQAREERRQRLEVRPLPQAARDRHERSWRNVQAQFVDDPRAAVAGADSLIQSVMTERGYPVENFDQRAADISVDHPRVVENYREGHRLAEESASGSDSTETLRQAMRHYRELFDELVEPATDEPIAREARSDGDVALDDRNPAEPRKVR